MKYQQLENLESGWKWHYLVKKHQVGEPITCHLEKSTADEAIKQLIALEHSPIDIQNWISKNLNPELVNRMNQTIRAKRKRHFNAEQQNTRKKSIDLEFLVWQRLADLAQKKKATLSETITQLIEEEERKDQFTSNVSTIKNDLLSLLGSGKTDK